MCGIFTYQLKEYSLSQLKPNTTIVDGKKNIRKIGILF